MKPIYRLLTIFLIPLLLAHFWIYSISPALAFAGEKITTFEPETAEPQPVETAKAPKKGMSKWWYVVLIAAAGGAAAAAGGGGGGGGGDGGGSSGGGGDTGTISVGW